MIHAIITALLSISMLPFGLHNETATVCAAFYIGREHAQAEHRSIYTYYDRKRTNAPWWCGFELRVWGLKSLFDWGGPFTVALSTCFI